MKKIIKWICIISCAFLLLGIALVVIGVKLGGKTNWTVNIQDGVFNTASDADYVTKAYDLEAFSQIETDTCSEDFKVVKGEGYKVEYCTLAQKEPKIDVKDGKLSIKVPSNEVMFSIGTVTKDEYITVTVPDNDDVYDVNINMTSGSTDFEKINIKGSIQSTSGEVTVNETKAKEDLSVEYTSGEVNIDNSLFKNISVKSTSGNFTASNIESSVFKYEATSGSVDFSNIKTDEMFTDILSGDIDLENLECKSYKHSAKSGSLTADNIKTESFDTDIFSGDVDITNMTVDDIVSKSTSGSVEIGIVGSFDDYGFDIHATSGDIECGNIDVEKELVMGNEKEKQIKGDLSSGSITITFK